MLLLASVATNTDRVGHDECILGAGLYTILLLCDALVQRKRGIDSAGGHVACFKSRIPLTRIACVVAACWDACLDLPRPALHTSGFFYWHPVRVT